MKYIVKLLILGSAFLLLTCGKNAPKNALFEAVPAEHSGITFENTLTEEPLFNSINYLYFYDGGGVAVGDLTGDDLPEIYLAANNASNRLYQNLAGFQFKDITEEAGVGGGKGSWTTGVTMADINSDGWLDIYVCSSNYLDKSGPNQLFINNGDLTFTERAAEYGLDFSGLSRQAAFFDYDRDNDLDMFLLNHSVHTRGTYKDTTVRNEIDAQAGDKLFRNDNGFFVDVTSQAGIYQSRTGYGLGVAISDLNLDGWPDIYISNDFHEDDYLYYNNGDGTFSERMKEVMRHVSLASMGNDIADINNDRLADVVVLDMMPVDEKIRKTSVFSDTYNIYDIKKGFGYYDQVRRNTLQLNRGVMADGINRFSEIGALAGIHATDWSWASLIADFDNDGYKDIFVTNGIYRRSNDLDYLNYIKQQEVWMTSARSGGPIEHEPIVADELQRLVNLMPSVPLSNAFFHSNGDLTFTNRADEWGLAQPGFSSGAAYADLDNDNDLDLIVNNVNGIASLYRNRLDDMRADISGAPYSKTFILIGRGGEHDAIGARIEAWCAGEVFTQELYTTRGFQSSVAPRIVMGLGEHAMIDSLIITWPDGSREVHMNQSAGGTHIIQQGTNEAETVTGDNVLPAYYTDVTDEVALDYHHKENIFIEFNREPLIPHFISTEGPAVAVADVNNDGLEDIFLGGAKRQAGSLFLQQKSGEFVSSNEALFAEDAENEDVDALFFDANGDRWPDLVVISGGNEFWGKSKALADRLYINEGAGQFRRQALGAEPVFGNNSCVAAADFDGDGDQDLFIGGRSVPRRYGETPRSYLLMNDGAGLFSDATMQVAPELMKIGMVTDAQWADCDGNGSLDLIIAGEWMPVTVLLNHNHRLVRAHHNSGIVANDGWWNVVKVADVNNDQQPDLIVGNLGLNSILQASSRKPIQLYVKDFSGNKRPEQILSYYNGNEEYPLVSLEQLGAVIPTMMQRFPNAEAYAGKTIDEIFTPEELADAKKRFADEFASMVLLNRGAAVFDMVPLPAEAQFAPIYAIHVEDVNNDGYLDLLLGGNHAHVSLERGFYDADYGSLLIGNGEGQFNPVPLKKSGFITSGDMRGIVSLKDANGKNLIIAVRNDDSPMVFKKR